MDITSKLRDYIVTELAAEQSVQSINTDDDLLTLGIIDSMGLLRVSAFIEENFGIEIASDDLVPENFLSIEAMENFIKTKQQ